MNKYEFFSDKELTCQCGCGLMLMDSAFMEKVIDVRRELGFAFSVTSAYRCPEHNNNVSVTGFYGPHVTGRALDVRANSRQKSLIQEAMEKKGMTRFGIAKSFIHFDDLTEQDLFDEKVTWSY